jgi:cytochrome oxidase assembly protein ShyY1
VFKFLLTPKWIIFTAICLALVPGFLQLSNWQWDRLHARQELNAVLTAALSATPIEFESLGVAKSTEVADSYQWRAVNLVGSWETTGQVLVRKRSLESEAGFWVATPLLLENGKKVVVIRGWTAAGKDAHDTPSVTEPPSGQVKIATRLRLVTPRSEAAPTDLPAGQVDRIIPSEIVDSSALDNAYFELTASEPNSIGDDIRLLPAPEISEGPHRSYAMQWQFFTIMLFVGWVILVRNEVQTRKQTSQQS